MSIRSYDSDRDAAVTQVMLSYVKADEVDVGWQAYVNDEPLSDHEMDVCPTIDDALEALKQANWLHLPVSAHIKKEDFSSAIAASEVEVQVHDPGISFGKYLLKDPAYSVCKLDNGEIRVGFIGEDAGEIVSGSKYLTDGAAEQLEALLSKARNHTDKLRVVEKVIDIRNIAHLSDITSTPVSMIAVGGPDDFVSINMISWHDEFGEPFLYEVESVDQHWRSAGPVPDPQAFGNLELAREFMHEMVKKAELDLEVSPTP